MIVKNFKPEDFTLVSEGLSFGPMPPEETAPPPFNSIWVKVAEGKETPIHRHHDREFFIIVQGRGLATCEDETVEVGPGDVLSFPPLSYHTIRSVGGEEDLLLLDIYWADMAAVEAGEAAERIGASGESSGKRVLVFGAPPTANGDLHLGHVSGPYLSADVHTRFRRMQGDDAHLILGTDTSQCWVAEKAYRMGRSPLETADAFSARIRETLEKAKVSFSRFYAPAHTPSHKKFVSDMVEKLYAEGYLVAKDAPALVCRSCDRYLFEAFVAGTCPHCGAGCCGNGCEECCQPNDCVDIIDPTCRICGAMPVQTKIRRLYFPLEKVRSQLEAYLESAALRPQHRALCVQALAGDLPELVASHVTDWGIPVPIEGFEGQCISSWVEGGAGYLTAADQFAGELWGKDGWESCWKSEDAEVVQFFGFDNSWVHALFFPATFMAFDSGVHPPVALIANHFYRL